MGIRKLQQEAREVLENNILPYWMNNMVDREQGGFYGRITGEEQLMADADKGSILNARILWTFSAAYRLLGNKEYLATATRAKEYLLQHFIDKQYGGVYWCLNSQGEPVDTKKQIYAIGFAIYGLSEYYRVTNDSEALKHAIALFECIEEHSFDGANNGYFEAFTRTWEEIGDMRLSDKDANERKTMNTHLHILEPYTNLYRVWKDERLKKQLHNLILLFVEKIRDASTGHLNLFFDDTWNVKSSILSYGHDIEASWLIHEAVLLLDDKELTARVAPVVQQIACAASEGISASGGMVYEKNAVTGHTDGDYHWWVQAEAVVGYLSLYQHFKDESALNKAVCCWNFIKENLLDTKYGEWYWSLTAAGVTNRVDDKAGFWKCPYHNGRACLEIIERFV
ncbi:N-acyl-D-glucosamine 2-epimerase [Bacteroides sp. 214]|uniref:AGE family epimerase/isomerase n=1 Tax=Bacteroides sp. 214 TaxID=2302935 RepID=UPI0013D31086|nr:AGE family epimerase/isomerase [Bacteroides sp. 214]NDW13700.1 N-acyl-D-glucosamine 2-epimerase [Bacteroides sp. 214]